jgi:hypothetical protein
MNEKNDDPSGDTAMFRAFVEHTAPEAPAETATNRGAWIVAAIAAALVILVVVALSML